MMKPFSAAACLLVCLPAAAGLTVGDPNGRPVESATVTILLESKGGASQVFGDEPIVNQTDDRGRLPFDLPLVEGATVIVDHEAHAPAIVTLGGGTPPPSITLQDGLALTGQVEGDGQTPLRSGSVCAIRTVTRQNGGTFEIRRCSTVAADGTWTLRALASGPHRLEIGVPAYLPLSNGIDLPAETWKGKVDPGLRARLSVEDSAGRPVADATVECDGAVSTTTDAHGTALVSVARSGIKCRALAPDGAESRSSEVVAPSTARQTLRLRPARIVTGTLVTNEEDDPPVPQFTLLGKIEDKGQTAISVKTLSNVNGTFRIRVPDDEPHALRVEAPGILPVTTQWFTLPPGGGTADLGVILLRHGAGVRGQVVDAATQKPLAGAVVSLEAQGRARLVLGRFGKSSTISDSDGSFLVAGVGLGSYRMRVAWRDLPPSETAVDLREESIVSVGTISLHRETRISGKVFRDEREPIGAVRVELVRSRLYDTEASGFGYTDSEGAFGPISCAPGNYRLIVRGDDMLWDQEIEIPAGGESRQVDIHIRSTRLVGVIREDGVPVPGGEVLLQRSTDLRGNLGVAVARNPRAGTQVWSGRSDSQFSAMVNGAGMFTLGDVPSGRMVLEYFGPSGQRVTRTIDIPDEKDVSVTVDTDGWALQGRIDDGEMNMGLTARVELVAVDGTAVFRGSTNGSGDFAIDRLAPGMYDLVASAEGYRTSDPLRVIVGNEAPQPVHVLLTKAADVTLNLALRRGPEIPAAGVAVSIVDGAGRQLRAFPTWPDGTLHLVGLPPGKVHIIWSDPLAGVGTSAPIELRSGPQELTLLLEPGKDLVVRCEGMDCSGTRLGSIALTNQHGVDLAPFLRGGAVVFSEDGAAHLGRVAPGSYDVAGGPRLEVGGGPGEVELFLKRR